MGSSRAWPLLLLAAAAAAAHADAHAAQERANGDASGARDAAALATGDITADDVRAAWEAWNKLRDATTNHTVRKRAASLPEQPEQPDPPAAAAAAAAAAADPKRVRVAEFTLSAESSFTAVSRALNRLADRSRSPAGAPIAATEFVVEGSVDADTIQSYLRSHAARGSLAAAEADALRKVVGMLLQAPAHAPAKAPASSTAAPRQRAKRAAPRLFQPQVGQPYESPPTATSSPASPAPPPPEGVLSGRFVWALADDSFDAARPAEGIRRRMPPLYLAPIVPRVLRGGDDDDDDDSDDSGGGEDLARAKSSGDFDNQDDEEQDDDDDEADEFIEVEDDRGSELEGGGIANRRLSDEGDFELYDEDEGDNIASDKSDIF